jgi:hypothetical protein
MALSNLKEGCKGIDSIIICVTYFTEHSANFGEVELVAVFLQYEGCLSLT